MVRGAVFSALVLIIIGIDIDNVRADSNTGRIRNHQELHQTEATRTKSSHGLRSTYTLTISNYSPPAVRLTDASGENIILSDLLAQDVPVLMQFIFTSCATICPLLSATFSRGQKALSSTHDDYRMLSISVDPEYDTPKRLAVYAKRNNASENWTFLTGAKGDISKVMRAFDVLYQGDNKMYHQPYTFLRPRASSPWIKIDGLLTVNELIREYNAAFQSADVRLN